MMHMQGHGKPQIRKTAAPDVRLDARITPAVDLRLRMLALVERQSLSAVLSALLDKALPPADQLAAQLTSSEAVAS